ncbi:MAG: hypothetical protein ACRDTG_07915 [Pseudonocardiaceae bacterium]
MNELIQNSLQERATKGESAAQLVEWLKSELGDSFTPFAFVYHFFAAFDIPLQVLREAENWVGIGCREMLSDDELRSRGLLSDDEFSRLVDPYLG